MPSPATILEFAAQNGFGKARLADGREMFFDSSVAYAPLPELRPGAEVLVEVGPSALPGRARITRLWFAGRPPPEPRAPPPEPQFSADQALKLCRDAGLATRFKLPTWRKTLAAQRKASGDTSAGSEFKGDVVMAALGTLYGTDGPTTTSLADHAFAVEERELRYGHQEAEGALVTWLGRPLSPRLSRHSLESVVAFVGDSLYLDAHGPHGGPLLFELQGRRFKVDGSAVPFSLFVLRTEFAPLYKLPIQVCTTQHPDSEAAMNRRFRGGGPTLSYEEHVARCRLCRGSLRCAEDLPEELAQMLARIEHESS